MMLSDVVSVSRRFQRSVRVDTDLGAAGALHGFVCHGSSKAALETMAKLMVESGQRAFTWTGPYGGGKSSLALALCASVGGDSKQRKLARALLDAPPDLDKAFPAGRNDWLVVPVVGRRRDPVADLREAIAAAVAVESGPARTRRRKADPSGRDVIERLQGEAAARSKGGVLVVLDEMGKFLEGAGADGTDIHFFQELAEAASRCEGRMVVLGILHQAFEQYAFHLGREVRDEWAKVQGRYIDIPIVTAIDEVIDLIGRAIVTESEHAASMAVAEEVAEAVRTRRPGSPDDLAARLDACWPLHPVTAALLGPVSRRRFGQNERSTFGFLASSEPEGLQEFLRNTLLADGTLYDPARLWDYLRINLEPAILASPDGHRWALGAEAVERCEGRGSPLHVRLAKTIVTIDLFHNGSGIAPEPAVLHASLHDASRKEIDRALKDLHEWSVAIFRNHLNAWAIYAGSDFDIGDAVEEAMAASAGLDLDRLARLAELQPLLAKEHYHRTGTLRWFETGLTALDDVSEAVRSFEPRDGSSGKFLLAIPGGEETRQKARQTCRRGSGLAGDHPVAIGLPRNAWLVRDLGKELIALETVRANRPELEGDQVARREITARIASVRAQLEDALRTAFNEAVWHVRGKNHDGRNARGLATLASKLADDTFPDAPVIHSELVNRERPSSNSQAAVRGLLHAMVSAPGKKNLGIEGYPAERGLYSTVLDAAGLHGRVNEGLGFNAPNGLDPIGKSFVPMWRKAEEIMKAADEPVSLASLHEVWAAPPFGIRRGLLPILGMAFILAHEASVAVYAEEIFQPDLNDFVADRLLQDERLISLRFVDRRAQNQDFMGKLAKTVGEIVGQVPVPEPLAVARALVEFVYRLPNWTRRTLSLSREAQEVRRILLNASDPYRALFIDLPHAVRGKSAKQTQGKLAEALHELKGAYPAMLDDLCRRMLKALGHKGTDFGVLRERAKTVAGVSGDLRLDAFVTRLIEFDGRREDTEAIAGLVIHKPARDWSDMEPSQATFELAEHSLRFRQAEVLARVRDRPPMQHAVAVVFGTGETGRAVMKSFEVATSDLDGINELAGRIIELAKDSGLEREVLLAAVAEAGLRAVEEEEGVGAMPEPKALAS